MLEDKQVVVEGLRGADEAIKAVKESFELYRREEARLQGWK